MFSNVVMGLDGDLFENAINAKKAEKGVVSDTELAAEDLQDLVQVFKGIFTENIDPAAYPELVVDGAVAFPQDPDVQLRLAMEAVFGSWNNERAILYRKQNKIPDDLGTAVNVQCMVFGNKGNTSATGVAFTRDAATGKKVFYGDYLVNAQGEDVVAGIRRREDRRAARCPRAAGPAAASADCQGCREERHCQGPERLPGRSRGRGRLQLC